MAGGPAEPRPEALLWVRITVPDNCVGLRPGQNLLLRVADHQADVLNGVARLGQLEPAGVAWIRRHGYSSCVFVRYGADPTKRFQVTVAAR
jgi:hypothetical protein